MPNATKNDTAKQPWPGLVKKGQILTVIDTHGQQAVDFLCYSADDLLDRYSATNTIKVQGNIYSGKGTVLYADSGKALLTILQAKKEALVQPLLNNLAIQDSSSA